MLPLAGTTTLAVIGKEVVCGRERADLVAVEVETGRPVVIEVKLASNTDRRRSLTQVLGYAAFLRRLDADGLNTVLRSYLDQQRLRLHHPRREGGRSGRPGLRRGCVPGQVRGRPRRWSTASRDRPR
jgi:hypothetical protein